LSNIKELRYFVLHLSDRDFRPDASCKYEVQVLDAKGRAKKIGYLRDEDIALSIEGEDVPQEVIKAAKRQEYGKDDYVDVEGKQIKSF
jgi:hypothetical protein